MTFSDSFSVQIITAKNEDTCRALWKDWNGYSLTDYEENLVKEHNLSKSA